MANEMPGLLGRKLGMTQIFDENDNFLAVTVIEVGENTVIRHKTADGPDGYTAVQLGLGEQKAQRVNKPETGHFAANNVGISRHVREIRVSADDLAKYPAGGTLKAAGYLATRVARMPRSPRTAVEGSPVTPTVSGISFSASRSQSLMAVGPPYLLRISMKFSAPMESS